MPFNITFHGTTREHPFTPLWRMWRRVGMLKTIERQRPWKEEKCCHSHHYHRRYRWRSLKRWMWHLLHTLVCHMKPFSHSQDSAWRFWPLKEVCQMYICLNFLLTLLLLAAIGSQSTPSSAWNTRTSTSTLLLRFLHLTFLILLSTEKILPFSKCICLLES